MKAKLPNGHTLSIQPLRDNPSVLKIQAADENADLRVMHTADENGKTIIFVQVQNSPAETSEAPSVA